MDSRTLTALGLGYAVGGVTLATTYLAQMPLAPAVVAIVLAGGGTTFYMLNKSN